MQQAPVQLRLQDPILGNQIFIPQQQLLVHGPVIYARMRAHSMSSPSPADP
jgi:hypothetical protein